MINVIVLKKLKKNVGKRWKKVKIPVFKSFNLQCLN